jgi:hypothetical protein
MLKPGKKDRALQIFSIFSIITCHLILAGCVTGQVMLDRAIVLNDTEGIISDVKVRHE